MKPFISNSKAGFNYETLETFEGGLQLLGHEVKSIRLGHASISESFIIIEDGELFLVKAYVAPYQIKNIGVYDPYRKRKLLIKKSELKEIIKKRQEAGLTLIPLSLYDKRTPTGGRDDFRKERKSGFLKLQFALARGKKTRDKRNTIKERDTKREIDRLMKSK